MAENWYFVSDGERQGPISLDELESKIQSLEMPVGTLVWREGMREWVKYSELRAAPEVEVVDPFEVEELETVLPVGEDPEPPKKRRRKPRQRREEQRRPVWLASLLTMALLLGMLVLLGGMTQITGHFASPILGPGPRSSSITIGKLQTERIGPGGYQLYSFPVDPAFEYEIEIHKCDFDGDFSVRGISGMSSQTIPLNPVMIPKTNTIRFRPSHQDNATIAIQSYGGGNEIQFKVTKNLPKTLAKFLKGESDNGSIMDSVIFGGVKNYEIEMDDSHHYTIDLESSSFDAYLEIFDPRGVRVASDDDGGNGLNSRIRFLPTAGGKYRVAAQSLGRRNGGPYTLTIRKEKINVLTPGKGNESIKEKHSPGRRTSHYVRLDGGKRYNIDVLGKSMRPMVFIREPQSHNVFKQDSNNSRSESINVPFSPPRTGVYEVEITSNRSAGTSEYELIISEDIPQKLSFGKNDIIGINGKLISGRRIEYHVPIEKYVRYTFSGKSESSRLALFYYPSLTNNSSRKAYSAAPGESATIQYRGAQDGYAKLIVTESDGQSGSFHLDISKLEPNLVDFKVETSVSITGKLSEKETTEYIVPLKGATTYLLDLTSEKGLVDVTVGTLNSQQNNYVWKLINSKENSHSRLVLRPNLTGEYVVTIKTQPATKSADYQLTLRTLKDVALSDSAQPIQNRTEELVVGGTDDFLVDLQANTPYLFEAMAMEFHPVLELSDNTTMRKLAFTTDTKSKTSQFVYRPTQSGPYRLSITGNDGKQKAKYELRVVRGKLAYSNAKEKLIRTFDENVEIGNSKSVSLELEANQAYRIEFSCTKSPASLDVRKQSSRSLLAFAETTESGTTNSVVFRSETSGIYQFSIFALNNNNTNGKSGATIKVYELIDR